MAKLFKDLLAKGAKQGILPGKDRESREWYRNKARNIKLKQNENSIMSSGGNRLKNQVALGNMYMFYYDPKHKKTLPYYDMFPLIFPIAKYDDGFLGINFHYLPYQYRAVLMDALYDIVTDEKMDERTKLRISYGILKSATKYKYFKPCIKRYLTSHLRSRFLYIHPTEWDIALMAPLARFEKASQQQVWKDSRHKINGGRN
jgi:hypothetical protein